MIVLASSSPRRVDLLRSLGLDFDVVPSHVDETVEGRVAPEQMVVDLAVAKAREVAGLIGRGRQRVVRDPAGNATAAGAAGRTQPAFVLGADTTVVLDEEIIGKPGSPEEAAAMLAQLSGRCHQVYTGVALLQLPENRLETGCQVSRVYFRPMLPAEIDAYVATGEPMDKAGAYALQGTGSAFVEKIEGCFTNIIGLPVPLVVEILRRFGVSILGLP